MTVTIPESHADLIGAPVFATIVTLLPDGTPHAAVVWWSRDGDTILINSAAGRRKNKNMRRDPRVTLMAIDPQNPYRYIEIRGRCVEITAEGALDHINSLSLAYVGRADYYETMPNLRGVEQRELFKIEPLKVIARG